MGYVGSCSLCACLEGRLKHPLLVEGWRVVVGGARVDLEEKAEMERQADRGEKPFREQHLEVNRGGASCCWFSQKDRLLCQWSPVRSLESRDGSLEPPSHETETN